VTHEEFLRIEGPPDSFQGKVRLPASKSYVHRALFIAAMCDGPSDISACGTTMSDDVSATMDVLRAFGSRLATSARNAGTISVYPNWKKAKIIRAFAKGSGTTARLAIAFAALAPKGTVTRIVGNKSLSERPMQPILDALNSLDVICRSENDDGHLPVTVSGGGIRGTRCEIDGSISSQFISSLLISFVKSEGDCTLGIKNPSKLVSKPYVSATIKVLEDFGFGVKVLASKRFEYEGFVVRGRQKAPGRRFQVPGDMSAAGTLIGATISAKGQVVLSGVNLDYPQSDSIILSFAERMGGAIRKAKGSLFVRTKRVTKRSLNLDLRDAPDLVPGVAGLAAGAGLDVRISNIGHLKFKESDRLHTLAEELGKLGVETRSTYSSLAIFGTRVNRRTLRKPIVLDSKEDHRMLMAFTIAGLSGRFGEIFVSDPGCVAKSYPGFIKDIQRLCGETDTVKIVSKMKVP
jgi:3-phosphoshikimate 1-carboxyvinyltransferase